MSSDNSPPPADEQQYVEGEKKPLPLQNVHSAETTPLLQNVPLAPQTAGGATVIVQQPTPASPKFRDFPVVIIDDKGNQYTTELRYVNGLLTWVAVGISCLVAGSFGLPCIGLIPLCIKAFKDIEHVNPNDGSVVGKYDRGADLGLK